MAVGGLWGEDSGEVEGDFDPDQEASADRTVSPFTEKDDDINGEEQLKYTIHYEP